MAKKYIKSYSNYVLKTKHQQTNDGTIYERDITTIGGRDQFARGQVPIYRTGNFVITTNNDINDYKKTPENDWHRNDEGEIWTLNTLKHYEKDEKSSYDKKIVIKKDYFDLRDFAYYGSCSELMRVSIDDILKNYPGELFVPYETLYIAKDGSGVQYTEEAAIGAFGKNGYTIERSGIKGYYTSSESRETRVVKDSCGNDVTIKSVSLLDPLSEDEKEELEQGKPYTREFKYITDKYGVVVDVKSLSLIDNPFLINIHDKFIPDNANPLRYFANGGIDNYVAYLKLNDADNLSIDGEWKIDSEHEYAVTIEEIVFDGLGESISKKEVFSAERNSSAVGCDTEFLVNLIANVEGEVTSEKCLLECIDPGKYLGRVKLCFRKNDYSFKTTPGLYIENGKPVEVCCDGVLEFDKSGGEGKYYGKDAQIDSFRTDDCTYFIDIYLFMGNNNEIKYLVEDLDRGGNINFSYDNVLDNCISKSATAKTDFTGTFKWENFVFRIRPNKDVIEEYFNNLDSFEKVLLNRESDPIYTANFELISDNDYGMYTYTKEFTFPTTYGGYNLGSNGQAFTQYVNSLSEIGEYYDSLFTDNLWRSMTHEAIKNFDWTYTRHYTPGDEEPYIEGGTKIQKVIRLYGREFDEVKSYIDAIDDLNTITYDNVNNLPDYFFTDKLEESGWDVKLIHPLELSEFVNGHDNVPIDIHTLFVHKYDEDGNEISTEDAEKLNYFYDSTGANKNKITIQRVFNQKNISIKPYSCSNITTVKSTKYSELHPELVDTTSKIEFDFYGSQTEPCVKEGDISMKTSSTTGENVINGYHNDCGDIIKIYCNENEYSSADVNTEFMKRFILNSPEIWRHKGTIEGMEMLLSLFGLRSKNRIYTDDRYFVNKKGISDGDEYSQFNTNVTSIDGCDSNLSFNISLTAEKGNCLSLTEKGREYYKNYKDNLYNLYDYDIKEYTLFTTREEDEWIPSKNMYKLDWVNSTKLVPYNSPDNTYHSYQGLPVSYRNCQGETISDKKRYLYPHFNTYDTYDGNPYYQMDGGWMQKKPFMFDIKNNIIMEDYASENRKNKALFTETIKNIKCVNNLQELLSNPSLANGSGDICQVTDLSGRYAIIDGYVYPLLTELTDHEGNGNTFFYAYVQNGSLSVGNALFTDYVIISNPYFNNNKQRIDLTDEYYADREIKIYLIKTQDGYDIDVYSKDNSISTFTVFENGKYMEGDNYTNYFRINNVDYYNELSVLGWQQLKDDEYEYYRMNTLTDYREGNNPHTGHMRYDNGHKYLTYFQKIFKHVNENDLIDYRQYEEDDLQYIDDMNSFGFSNLIDDDECEPDYDKFLREDNKCHYLGDYFPPSDRNGWSCLSNRDEIKTSTYKLTDIFRKNIIKDDEGNPIVENLRYGKVYSDMGEYGDYDEDKIDNVTDQIVNTKRMEIEFFIKNPHEFSKEWLEEVKYIDSIILPYLSQMIPSTVIWRVKYTTRDKEAWNAVENPCITNKFYTDRTSIPCVQGTTQFNIRLTAEKS